MTYLKLLVLSCVCVIVSSNENVKNKTTRVALTVFSECLSSEDLLICFKQKVADFLFKLGRVEKLSISDNIKLVRAINQTVINDQLTEVNLDKILPKSLVAKDAALTKIISDEVRNLLQSVTLEVSVPQLEKKSIETGKVYVIIFVKYF